MKDIDFNTIRGLDQWVAAFPEQFEPLNARQRKILASALANGAHEGWKPTVDDVAELAEHTVAVTTRRKEDMP